MFESGDISLAEVLGLLLGGGGIGYILTIKYAIKQAKSQASQAESEATKSVQDVYQELITDVRSDREEQKQYIAELKEDRNHLRNDRDELRRENEKMRKTTEAIQDEFSDMKRELARQGRKLEIITPFLCSRISCEDRVKSSVSELVGKKKKKENNV